MANLSSSKFYCSKFEILQDSSIKNLQFLTCKYLVIFRNLQFYKFIILVILILELSNFRNLEFSKWRIQVVPNCIVKFVILQVSNMTNLEFSTFRILVICILEMANFRNFRKLQF